jgi:hypothetical protein
MPEAEVLKVPYRRTDTCPEKKRPSIKTFE